MGGPLNPELQEPVARKMSDRELLRRVAGLVRPYLSKLAMLIGVMVVNGGVGVLSPLLYKYLLDRALPQRDTRMLNWVALGLISVAVVGGLLGLLTRYLSTLVGSTLVYDLRQRMYEHLQRLSMGFFTERSSGEIVSRFQQDVAGTHSAVAITLPALVNNTLTAVTTLVAMVLLDWRLSLVAIALIPMLIWPAKRAEKKLRDLQRESLELSAKMSSVVSETMNVSGAMLTRLHGQQQADRQKFREVSDKVRATRIRSVLAGRSLTMTLGLAVAFGTTLVYWGGGHLVIDNQLSVGTLVAFTVYLRRLYQPLVDLSRSQVEVSTSLASFERVFEGLDAQVDVKESPNAVRLASVKGEVRFEQVSFAYPRPKLGASSSSKALEDVTLQLHPGELVALVGPSGAGKSTLAHMLMRLYDPSSGRITLDGHDLKDLSLDSLRQHVGLVTQDTYLFHDTVRANLQYANPNATQQQIEEACRKAAIHDAILQLSQGYDTVVGEGGYRLSGGERQRLSIARVILKNPSLLILDEPTSHLDARSEAELQQALESVFAGRTCLVIAHRLSTVRKANRVLVLEKGRLVEEGTHADLLARQGLYASLTYLQSGTATATT